jgi:predicted nucleic-acid-binding protein
MKIVDANIILRYLLNDTEDLSAKAADLLENNEVMVPNEVIAEIVYVLEKVYKIKSEEISSSLMELFDYDNLQVNDHEIYTFDKKLNKLLKS